MTWTGGRGNAATSGDPFARPPIMSAVRPQESVSQHVDYRPLGVYNFPYQQRTAMSENPYQPTTLGDPRRTSRVRLILCLTTMLFAGVVSVYFTLISFLFSWLLFVTTPGWPIDQVLLNVVINAGLALVAAIGFRAALRAMNRPRTVNK